MNVCHAAPWSAGPGGLGAWTHQIFSCPFLDLSSFTSELHTVQPPSYRYLSCQSSGWSSRFEAAATTPRRALEIFPLPLETAGLAARAGPWGARAANRDVAGIAAVAVGIDIRARANRWPARRASRDDVASPKRDTFQVARTALVSSVRSKRCVIPPSPSGAACGAQSASKLTSESVSKTGKVSSREISGSRVAREKSSGGNDKTKRRLTNHQRESVVESQTVVVPRRRRETLFFFFLSFFTKNRHHPRARARLICGRGGGGAGRGLRSPRVRDIAHPGPGRRGLRRRARRARTRAADKSIRRRLRII